MKEGYVYILTHKKRGSLYVGVTSDLFQRIHEHKSKIKSHFPKRYNLERLVYVESFVSISDAITREKRLKRYQRAWKIQLIEAQNPDWRDLYVEGLPG